MPLYWTLSSSANTVTPLSAFAPLSFKLTFRSRDIDEVRLLFDADNTTALSTWPVGVPFSVYVADSPSASPTRIFYGRCEKILHRQSGKSRQVEIIFHGGWSILTRQMYYQAWPAGYIAANERLYSDKPWFEHYTTRVILGRCPEYLRYYHAHQVWGQTLAAAVSAGHALSEYLTIDQQLCDILTAARITNGLSQWRRGSSHISVSSDFVPLSERLNLTCAEAVNATLSSFPNAVSWYDHADDFFGFTTTPPALSVSLDAAEDIQIARIHSCEASVVKLYFEKIVTSDAGNKYYSSHAIRYPPDDCTSAECARHEEYSDALVETFGMLDAATARAIPSDLAQTIYNSACGPFYEGDVTLVDQDPPGLGLYRPGKALNLTGGETAWGSMKMPIQSVEFDVSAGRTTIQFGPPNHLEPQDLISLARANRKQDGVPSLSKMVSSVVRAS